jgi:two-component system nitrate/nitrite response regulator NarL
VRVALVDGDSVLHETFRDQLTAHEPDWQLVAYTQGGVALAALPAASPQLVLLERTLPDGCGLEWLRRCQSQMPGLPVVILSPENCAKTLLAALLAGARGYWVKSRDVGALVERLRGVLAGKLGLCDQAEHLLPQAFALLRQRTENQWGLSWREHEIMTSLCRHGTDKEVAKDLGIAAATVHVHLRNTFKKLGVHGRNAAVAKFLLMFPGGGGGGGKRSWTCENAPTLFITYLQHCLGT